MDSFSFGVYQTKIDFCHPGVIDSVLASSACPINAIDIVILSQFKINKFSSWRVILQFSVVVDLKLKLVSFTLISESRSCRTLSLINLVCFCPILYPFISGFRAWFGYQAREDTIILSGIKLKPEIKVNARINKNKFRDYNFVVYNSGPIDALQLEAKLISHRYFIDTKDIRISVTGSETTFSVQKLGPLKNCIFKIDEHFLYENAVLQEPKENNVLELRVSYRRQADLMLFSESAFYFVNPDGLTPQSIAMLGGFKAQGRDADAALRLVEDAKLLEEAGVCMILVEAVPPEVGKIIAERAQIPIIGIGAGPHVDGQCLIVHDMLGMFEAFTPKFVKKYANIGEQIVAALKEFAQNVVKAGFPAAEHCYKMPETEIRKLEELLQQRK